MLKQIKKVLSDYKGIWYKTKCTLLIISVIVGETYWFIFTHGYLDISYIIIGIFGIVFFGLMLHIFYNNDKNNKNEINMNNLTKTVMGILKKQGVESELDKDGDLNFQLHYLNYIFESDDEDKNWFRLTLPYIYEVEEKDDVLSIMYAINQINMSLKCVKCFMSGNWLHVSIESFVCTNEEFDKIFHRSVSACESAYMDIRKQIPN